MGFMKRKLSTILLVVIMLLTTNVTSALAANSSVPLTLTISSYGAPFISGSTGEHTVRSIKWNKYINRSDVGIDNASVSANAYFTKE